MAGSFTLNVTDTAVQVLGADDDGLRDGVVRLIDLIALRRAAILPKGSHDPFGRSCRSAWAPFPGSARSGTSP